MTRYFLLGRVLPYFPKRVSYPSAPSLKLGSEGSLGFEIQKSMITAELKIDKIENAVTALKSVEQTIQGLIDAYSFIAGDTFEVRMEAIEQDNELKVFKEKTLAEILTDVPTKELPSTELLMSAAIEHMSLRLALNNFKNAKRYTAYTGLYIYLAIENIKKYFYSEDSNNEGKEWEGLRAKLSLTREDIDFAKTFADHVRHGKYQDVRGRDNSRILKLGAEVIYKFYKYLYPSTV